MVVSGAAVCGAKASGALAAIGMAVGALALFWLAACVSESIGHSDSSAAGREVATATAAPTVHDAYDYRPCWSYYGHWGQRFAAPVGNVRWNPTGNEILFHVAGKIYAVAADGTDLRLLADTAPPVGLRESASGGLNNETHFDVSPNGDQLVYSTCEFPRPGMKPVDLEDFELEIATGSLAGDDVKQITFDHSPDTHPTWSPDGSRIAFLIREHLYSMASDGSDRRYHETRGHRVWPVPPRWSPDGSRIAVVGAAAPYLGGEPTVVVVGADGRAPMILTTTLSAPAWSPDGQRLAFAKRGGDAAALYTIAADGSDLQRITWIELGHEAIEPFPASTPGGWVRTVEWSPSGAQLLHSCGNFVCVVNLEGWRIGRSPLEAYVAKWSPDGSRIAVGSPDVQESPISSSNTAIVAIYTMVPDGGDMQHLVTTLRTGSFYSAGPQPPQGPVDDAGCATGAAVPEPAANPGLVSDCKVLLALRDRLAGAVRLNWSADRPISEWDGMSLSGSPRRVTGMFLVDEGLSGVLPTELGELSELESLILQRNLLTGSIPAALGELSKLWTLALDGNLLTGEIPPTLARLSKLTLLALTNNHLSGDIPPELGQMRNLKELGLHINQLTGSIPSELGELSALEYLSLYDNQLSGEIPPELGQLSNLRQLNLVNNQLTGPILRGLAELSSLEYLALADNRLSGEIPPEFARFAKGTQFELAGNQLSGCIPTGLRVSDRDRLGLKACEAQE